MVGLNNLIHRGDWNNMVATAAKFKVQKCLKGQGWIRNENKQEMEKKCAPFLCHHLVLD